MTGSLDVTLLLLYTAGCCLYQAWAQIDPCLIYSTYNENWRNPAAEESPKHCDSDMSEGWYTFLMNNDIGIIPTTCMQDNTCGTRIALYVDLEGQDMPEIGHTINASLCGSLNVLDTINCCALRQPVVIKRCGEPEAVIYYLKPPTVCPAAICVVEPGKDVEEKYKYKLGDVPRSLQTTTTTTAFPVLTTVEVDECSLDPGVCENGTCLNTVGSFLCMCHAGFQPDVNNTVCRDIDECLDREGVCEGGQCQNTQGSFFCACTKGYKFDIRTQNCVDINECEEIEDVCGVMKSGKRCTNNEGGFNCDCPEDHTLSSDGFTCNEVTTSSSTREQTSEKNTIAASTAAAETTTTTTTMDMTPFTSPSSALPNDSYTLYFVLLGSYLDSAEPEDTIMSHVEEASRSATLPAGSDSVHIQVHLGSSWSGVTIVYVTIRSNTSGDIITAPTVQDTVDLPTFTSTLPQNLTLLTACTKNGSCVQPQPKPQQPVSNGCDTHLLILIILVVVLVLCVLAFLSVQLYKHCSKRGTWVLPPDQKCDDESADCESTKPTDALNGDQMDGRKPDCEEGWWVVPLDQAPTDGDGQATATQDTPM